MDILKLAKRSVFLISSSFLKLFTQLTIIVLFAKKLSIYDYGIYQSIWMYVNIITVVTLFGLPSLLLSKNFNSIKSFINEHKKLFSFYTIFVVFFAIANLFWLDNNMSIYIKSLLISLIFIQITSILVEVEAVKKEREVLLLSSNIFFNLFYFFIHIYILYHNYNLSNLLLGIIILLLTKTIIQKIYLSKSIIKTISTNDTYIASQWFFLGFTDVVGVLFKWIDKWIILLLISLQEFSVYFNGSYEIPIYGLMVSAVRNVMLTEISKNIDKSNSLNVFKNSIYILSKIVLPSFCLMFFFYKEIFHFIFGNKYEAALSIFFITIFIIPTRLTSFTSILQVYNKAHIILKGAIIDLILAFCLMAILYPFFKLNGIAMACVISTYFQAFFYLWQTSKILQLPIKSFIPYLDSLKTLFISFLTMGIIYYLTSKFSENTTLLLGILSCALLIFTLCFYSFKLNKKQNIT